MSIYRLLAFVYPIIDRYAMPSKAELTTQIQRNSPGKLLDIGCGIAANWFEWSKHNCWGVDSSKEMIDQGLNKHDGERCILADARNLPFESNKFDIIVIAHMLSTSDGIQSVLSEAHRVLKKEGFCYIQNHDSQGWRVFDTIIRPFAAILGVKVPFYINEYIDASLWTVEKELTLGRFSYFKLITLRKR